MSSLETDTNRPLEPGRTQQKTDVQSTSLNNPLSCTSAPQFSAREQQIFEFIRNQNSSFICDAARSALSHEKLEIVELPEFKTGSNWKGNYFGKVPFLENNDEVEAKLIPYLKRMNDKELEALVAIIPNEARSHMQAYNLVWALWERIQCAGKVVIGLQSTETLRSRIHDQARRMTTPDSGAGFSVFAQIGKKDLILTAHSPLFDDEVENLKHARWAPQIIVGIIDRDRFVEVRDSSPLMTAKIALDVANRAEFPYQQIAPYPIPNLATFMHPNVIGFAELVEKLKGEIPREEHDKLPNAITLTVQSGRIAARISLEQRLSPELVSTSLIIGELLRAGLFPPSAEMLLRAAFRIKD